MLEAVVQEVEAKEGTFYRAGNQPVVSINVELGKVRQTGSGPSGPD